MRAQLLPPAVSLSIVALLVVALIVITGHCSGMVGAGFNFNLGVR